MINIKDQNDVQIWCDYQEETQQTNANFFLRIRFANFHTFIANVVNYDRIDNSNGYGYFNGDGFGNGNGNGYFNGDGNGHGDGLSNGNGYDNGTL